MRIKREKMETPFYYQHENYLIIFCETIEEFEKYKGDLRCIDVKSERWDSLIPQIYIDEMNEEILIQKCKKIIYGLSYQMERSNWIEYAKQYGKEIDIENDLQIMKYEDLPKKKVEKDIQNIQLKRESDTNNVSSFLDPSLDGSERSRLSFGKSSSFNQFHAWLILDNEWYLFFY